jgi:two-component SAPR family response regulator
MAELRYIIVEDNEEFAFLLQKYLEKIPDLQHLGTYGGTTDAVMNIERQKPDLLFLDINISGLQGPEFMDLLDYTPKVIVVSGHSEDIMNNYDIDYVDFIQKPPTIDRLKEAIEKCR